MTPNIHETLKPKTIASIRELVEINIDSYNGFTHAATVTNDSLLRDEFSDLAQQRIRQAVELNQLIVPSYGQRIWEGSIAGRIHRAIMDWKDKFGEGPNTLLSEVERGEVYIKAKYESVLSHVTQEEVVDVLHRHYETVKEAYDRIREVRAMFSAN